MKENPTSKNGKIHSEKNKGEEGSHQIFESDSKKKVVNHAELTKEGSGITDASLSEKIEESMPNDIGISHRSEKLEEVVVKTGDEEILEVQSSHEDTSSKISGKDDYGSMDVLSSEETEKSIKKNRGDLHCAEALEEPAAKVGGEEFLENQSNQEDTSSKISEEEDGVDSDVEYSAPLTDFPAEEDPEDKLQETQSPNGDQYFESISDPQYQSGASIKFPTEMEEDSTVLSFSGYKKVNPAYQFYEKDISTWADQALQKRLGIFIGTDQQFITAAIDAVLKHPRLEDHNSLYIVDLKNENRLFQILHVFKMLIHLSAPSILVVEAYGVAAQEKIIDSLLNLYEGAFRDHRQQLSSSDCMLLFGFQRDYLVGDGKLVQLENLDHFLTVSVPEVEALLYTRFPKEAEELYTKADEKTIRPGPFIEDLIRRLKGTKSSTEAMRELCPETGEDRTSEGKLLQELDQGNLLYAAPAYVAAFFPGADYRDYQQLVETLLAGEVQQKDVVEMGTDSEGKHFEKTVSTEVKLEQEWKRHRTKLLRECAIRRERSTPDLDTDDFLMEDLSDPTVAFEDSSMQKNIRRLFLTDYFDFHDLFFEKMTKVGLVYTASSRLAKKLIMLAVHSAWANLQRHPSRVGEIVMQVAFSGEVSDVRFLEYEIQIRLERLAMLFKALLSREPLRHPAEEALDAFMRHRQFEFVHQLLSRISNIDGWNTLKWRKRLIEEGDPVTSGQISYHMYNGLFNSKNFSLEVFDTLTNWLPDSSDQTVVKVNRIAVYAAILMCEINLTPLANSPQREWVTRALEQFHSQYQRTQERLEKLIKWLYHPSVIEYFQTPQTAGQSILKDKTVHEIAVRLKRINQDIKINDFLFPVQPWRSCFSSYIQDICISGEAWQLIIDYGNSDALLQKINQEWSQYFSLVKSETGDPYILEVAQSLTLFEWCRKLDGVDDVQGLELMAEITRQTLTAQQRSRASVYWRGVSSTLLSVKNALFTLQGIKNIETKRRIKELGIDIDKQRSSFSRIERDYFTPK